MSILVKPRGSGMVRSGLYRCSSRRREPTLCQLLRRVQVQATGDTEFQLDEYVDRYRFEDVNHRMVDEGLKPA